MRAGWRRLAFAGALVVLATMLVFLITGGIERTGRGATPHVANSRIHQRFEIPPSARDVNYYTTERYSVANFGISEAEFLEWCRARGWRTSPVTPGHLGLYQDLHGRGRRPRIVRDGLTFDGLSGTVGYTGVFDRELRRASIQYEVR